MSTKTYQEITKSLSTCEACGYVGDGPKNLQEVDGLSVCSVCARSRLLKAVEAITTPDSRVRGIVQKARKYGRALNRLQCRFNAETGNYEYDVVVSKRASGSRGGRVRGAHYYTLLNLYAEQRRMLLTLPLEPSEPGAISKA